MEHPTNLMMISGVMVFSTPMELDRLKATVRQRMLRFDRFRQRVVRPILPGRRVYWEDDPHFNLDDHIHCIVLPPPGDEKMLQAVVSELMSTQLDLTKPLWEFHLVESYGDGCALIARLHHTIADGIALVHVLLSMTDKDPDAPWPIVTPHESPRRRRSLASTLWRPARSTLKANALALDTLSRESRKMLRHPTNAWGLARLAARTAIATGKLLSPRPDPKTPFKGKLGTAKQAAWSAPIPLTDVKAAGRAMGGTVNDVLLTTVTGALRRYLQSRGEPVDNVNIHAIVPVNLRPLEDEPRLGNSFGTVFLSLPVGIADPVDRLSDLKRRMDDLKDSPEAVVAFALLNLFGMAPDRLQDAALNIFGAKATAVMTNVPGPRETIYLAGAPLDTIMFWVPQSARLGLGVSIISYAGQVRVGVAADRGLVPDPGEIVSQFHAEFQMLLELSRRIEPIAAEEPGERTAPEIPAESIAEITVSLRDVIQRVNALIEETQALETTDGVEATPVSETKTLDEEEAVSAEPASAKRPDGCQALTKAGQQCKNRALADSDFCHVHQDYAAAEGE
jgi:WS/DGAT/MGAT family acyltransferase